MPNDGNTDGWKPVTLADTLQRLGSEETPVECGAEFTLGGRSARVTHVYGWPNDGLVSVTVKENGTHYLLPGSLVQSHILLRNNLQEIVRALRAAEWVPVGDRWPEEPGEYWVTLWDAGVADLVAVRRRFTPQGCESPNLIAWLPIVSPAPYRPPGPHAHKTGHPPSETPASVPGRIRVRWVPVWKRLPGRRDDMDTDDHPYPFSRQLLLSTEHMGVMTGCYDCVRQAFLFDGLPRGDRADALREVGIPVDPGAVLAWSYAPAAYRSPVPDAGGSDGG